jgi:hypothetical protein
MFMLNRSLRKMDKIQKHREGNICCEGCYRIGKKDIKKQILEIIEKMAIKPSNSITQFTPYIYYDTLKSEIEKIK